MTSINEWSQEEHDQAADALLTWSQQDKSGFVDYMASFAPAAVLLFETSRRGFPAYRWENTKVRR